MTPRSFCLSDSGRVAPSAPVRGMQPGPVSPTGQIEGGIVRPALSVAKLTAGYFCLSRGFTRL